MGFDSIIEPYLSVLYIYETRTKSYNEIERNNEIKNIPNRISSSESGLRFRLNTTLPYRTVPYGTGIFSLSLERDRDITVFRLSISPVTGYYATYVESKAVEFGGILYLDPYCTVLSSTDTRVYRYGSMLPVLKKGASTP